MKVTELATARPDHDVIVIGSGFAGLAMAHRLKREGRDDFVILERADSVGGTWRDNHYPGCACDIQSHLYSFSFAPEPGVDADVRPPGRDPRLPRALRHRDRRAAAPALRRHGRPAPSWTSRPALWNVEVNGDETITARVVVSGMGGALQPVLRRPPRPRGVRGPQLPLGRVGPRRRPHGQAGRGDRHRRQRDPVRAADRAARWSSSTFSSAPPPWIIPKRDRRISRARARALPPLPRASSGPTGGSSTGRSSRGCSRFTLEPRIMKARRAGCARRHIRRQISDPELRRKVTPDYVMGCKRILISNDYYPALDRDNVDLVTDGIERVTERGIVTADGREHRGRRDHLRHRLPRPRHAHRRSAIRGRGGADLAQVWAERGMQAHRGTDRRRLPEPLLPARPEHRPRPQLDRLHDRVAGPLRRRGAAQRWTRARGAGRQSRAPRHRSASTTSSRPGWRVPSGPRAGAAAGTSTPTGRNTTLWPDFTFRFRRQTAEFASGEYVLHRAPSPRRPWRRNPAASRSRPSALVLSGYAADRSQASRIGFL